MENQGLIALLQREVDRICMFINTPTPLADRETYNPFLRLPKEGQDLDSTLAALFGMIKLVPPLGEDFVHDQVFRRADFPRVVSALQRAQRTGRGAVAEVNLMTVENRWWGVKGGRRVTVVFTYLGRVYNWEAALSSEVAARLAPHRARKQPQLLPVNGSFKDFPHFSVRKLHLTAPVANALADMTGFIIQQNLDIFERVIRNGKRHSSTIVTIDPEDRDGRNTRSVYERTTTGSR